MVTKPGNTTSSHTLRLRSDATGMVKGLNAVDRELADVVKQLDRAQAAAANFTRASTGPSGIAGAAKQNQKAMHDMAQASKRSRVHLQNVGYQLQDTVVQLEMGTHWTRVFGQQGSQVFGMFGAWPAILSAVAAAVLGLAHNMGWFGKETVDATKAVEDLDSALDTFDRMTEKLRAAGASATTLTQQLQQLSEIALTDKLNTVIETFGEVSEFASASGPASGMILFGGAAREIADALDISAKSARELVDEMVNLKRADGAAEQAVALAVLREEFFRVIEASGEWDDATIEAFKRIVAAEEAAKRLSEEAEAISENTGTASDFMQFYADATFEAHTGAGMTKSTMAGVLEVTAQAAEQARMLAGYLQYAQTRSAAPANPFIQWLDSTGGVAGGKPGEGMSQDAMDKILGRGKYAPRTSSSKGGGGGAPDQDALEKYMETIRLQEKHLGLSEDQLAVYEALEGSIDKYSQAQIDAAVAATEAQRIQKEAAEEQKALWDHVGSTLEDGFMSMIDGTKSVEEAFKEMALSIVNELFRVLVLQKLIGSVGGGGLLGSIGGIFTGADGAVMNNGSIKPFASGGVVSSPTLFPMSGGNVGLMGEAGPEAIMPLSRTSNGDLGVAGPAITINNYTGQDVTVDRTEEVITIAVGRAVKAVEGGFSRSMATGQGVYARGIEQGYTSRRKV